MFTLDQILGLVGNLDDSPGDNTPRERFRRFLRDSVRSIGAVRDYVEACTKNKGPQYDRALQDLVNHTGTLIGFDVEHGRYKGVANDVGHDGLWHWNDFSIVVEVKTTDAFSINTASVVGYVDRLISAGKIPDWDHAMGLYVFGRTDSQLKQLENSIVAEKRTHQLRIATVDDVLSLAELVQDDSITADEAVALLRPAGVFVADTVRLLARIAAKSADLTAPVTVIAEAPTAVLTPPPEVAPSQGDLAASERLHLLTPVRDEKDRAARDTIRGLLSAGWYVFGESTPNRKKLKPGDRICFYGNGVGVVAEAELASYPEKKPVDTVTGIVSNPDKFPWSFRVTNVRFFFETPVVIDANLRSKLDAFAGQDPAGPWGWFVQATRVVSEHDFRVLTGQGA